SRRAISGRRGSPRRYPPRSWTARARRACSAASAILRTSLTWWSSSAPRWPATSRGWSSRSTGVTSSRRLTTRRRARAHGGPPVAGRPGGGAIVIDLRPRGGLYGLPERAARDPAPRGNNDVAPAAAEPSRHRHDRGDRGRAPAGPQRRGRRGAGPARRGWQLL